MKTRIHIATFILLVVICGCKQNKVSYKELLAERDSLLLVDQTQKQELNDLNTFVSTISDGLDSIAYQENILKIGKIEGTPITKSEIKTRLVDLSDLLARQKEKITILQDSLKHLKNAEKLNSLVSYLNEQLTAKEAEINRLHVELKKNKSNIAILNKQVSSLSESVEQLGKINQIQHEAIESQETILNEGYVIIGSKKQLRQKEIVKNNVLNPSSMIPEKFDKVDIRQFTEVHFPAKRAKVLTTMPQNSYTITKNGNGTFTLVINDPTIFWSCSNYLVIITD